jgi:ORF6N domain
MDPNSYAAKLPVPLELIERRIYLIRGQKVMLDSDLAELYQVPTKALNQAVRRNPGRFPGDFMFQLTDEELENWRSQIVTSNPAARMGLRRPPYAFTELDAMLSSVLNSDRAVEHSYHGVPAATLQEIYCSVLYAGSTRDLVADQVHDPHERQGRFPLTRRYNSSITEHTPCVHH